MKNVMLGPLSDHFIFVAEYIYTHCIVYKLSRWALYLAVITCAVSQHDVGRALVLVGRKEVKLVNNSLSTPDISSYE